MSDRLKVACVQLSAGNVVEPNIAALEKLVVQARETGAEFILTPENSVMAATMLVSWAEMPCTIHSPIPCQPKIFSTNTAPVTRPATE